MFRSIHSIVLLLCTATVLSSCPNNKLTYETCARHQDCVDLVGEHNCLGRGADGQLGNCTRSAVENCLCRTNDALHYCSSNADCLDEQYCARSSKSGSNICIGCLSLFDPRLVSEGDDGQPTGSFTPVDPVDTFANRCNNVTKAHPPCGQRDDLCSVTMPCDSGYDCVSTAENTTFACSWESTRCQCRPKRAAGPYDYTLCDPLVVNSCVEERETCAYYTTLQKHVCVSCDYAQNTFFFDLPDSTKCNSLKEKRKEPEHYVLGPNGRTLDRCASDKQCTGDRTCVAPVEDLRTVDGELQIVVNRYRRCNKNTDALCSCLPNGKTSNIQKCKTGSDCEEGESCISMNVWIKGRPTYRRLGLPPRNLCASNSFLDVMSNQFYRVVGNASFPDSNDSRLLTSDTCQYDWECKAPRRCTHATDTYGGCAGRRGCRCQPLMKPPCKSTEDCEAGEVCVSAPGALFNPLCISQAALGSLNVPDYYPVGSIELRDGTSPTPLPDDKYNGLTREPCLSTADCVTPRECVHWSDESNEKPCANNRRGCVCRLPPQAPDGPRKGNCTVSTDCSNGEACMSHLDGVLEMRTCISAIVFYEREEDEVLEEFGERHATPSPSVSFSVSMTPFQTPSSTTRATTSPEASVSVSATEEEPAPTAEASEVCVDVKLLAGMERSQLVFSEDRRASVLCDQYGSCATPGHMVTFNGRAMSMKTYCEQQIGSKRCSKRTAWVNSPRMLRGIRLDSKTDGLKMTVYSARYESWLEEIVLSRIIQVGL